MLYFTIGMNFLKKINRFGDEYCNENFDDHENNNKNNNNLFNKYQSLGYCSQLMLWRVLVRKIVNMLFIPDMVLCFVISLTFAILIYGMESESIGWYGFWSVLWILIPLLFSLYRVMTIKAT